MSLRLSAVIPTHNRPQLLRRAIESIRSQTVPVFEIIVVDEASEPPVALRPEGVQIVRHDRALGPGAARNAGAAVAAGDLIAFLDDDDIWLPTKVARVISAFEDNPTASVVFHRVGFNPPKNDRPTAPARLEHPVRRMLLSQPPHASGLVVTKRMLEEVKYDESMAAAEDLEYNIRLAREGEVIEIADTLAIHGSRMGYPTAISIQQRIEGRELIRDRYAEHFADPTISRHYELRMGHLHRRAGARSKAARRFARLALSNPSDLMAWKGLISTVLPERRMSKDGAATDLGPLPRHDSHEPAPRVTIGLPVLNGEAYLESTIDSILSQTFDDFELIIIDNGSTDRTREITTAAAERDARVAVHRREVTVGAHYNYNTVVPLARGEYFKWAAHDDLLKPKFLERCVEVLDKRPEVVLAHTWIGIIDGEGRRVRERRSSHNYEDHSPSVRFRKYIGDRNRSEPTFGLHRLSVLRETPLLGHFPGSDWVLLAELALRGRFHEVDEELFLNRDHASRSTKATIDSRLRAAWFEPGRSSPIAHHWHQLAGYVLAVLRVPMPLHERLRCLLFLGKWTLRHSIDLAMDLWVIATWRAGRAGRK